MKTMGLVMVAMLVSSAVLGCTGSTGNPPATKTIDVPMDDVLNQSTISRDMTLAVGDTLKVTLGSNHTTPYRWAADAKIDDATVVKQTGHEFVRSTSGLMGAPGTEVWTFTALKAGTAAIVDNYASVVDSAAAPVCTVTAKVTVH
ncbi:protease inhibitor I42 family protein [Mycobacterium haemophilum]